MCSIAETCERFQRIARRAFPKELCIRIRHKGGYHIKTRYDLAIINRQAVERIFKNFGPVLSAVSITIPRDCFSYEELLKQNNEIVQLQQQKQYDDSNFVLRMVARHCVDSLKVLKISGVKIPRFVTEELRPILGQLEVFKIGDSVVSDNDSLFAGCNSLIELRAVHVENCAAILANNFPKLELFGYGKPYKPPPTLWSKESDLHTTKITVDRLAIFILLHHENLKKVILANKMDDGFLSVFGNGFDKLEELGLNMTGMYVDSLHQLGALRSLKTLKLMHAICDDLTFIPAMGKLRELFLYDCRLPHDNSFQLYFLSQLTKLHIMHGETPVPNVVNLVRLLNHLKLLTIFHLNNFNLDEESFAKIVNIAEGRPQRLTMKCKFDFDATNLDKNLKVRLLPADLLTVYSNI